MFIELMLLSLLHSGKVKHCHKSATFSQGRRETYFHINLVFILVDLAINSIGYVKISGNC